jgi:EAL domain-containing protein (putative c-di-GMP-specific phosphodiesterase class I)
MSPTIFFHLALATAYVKPLDRVVKSQALDALKQAHIDAVVHFGPDSSQSMDILSQADHIFQKLKLAPEAKADFLKEWKLAPQHHDIVMNGPHKTPYIA